LPTFRKATIRQYVDKTILTILTTAIGIFFLGEKNLVSQKEIQDLKHII